jgi:hypothetical protein
MSDHLYDSLLICQYHHYVLSISVVVPVKYAWILTPKASSNCEVVLTYLYTQQPRNLSNVGLQKWVLFKSIFFWLTMLELRLWDRDMEEW